MRLTYGIAAASIAVVSLAAVIGARSQEIPKTLQAAGSDSDLRTRKNAWVIGMAGGQIDGTYMQFADELAKVVDDGDNLRILPVVSNGSVSNFEELLQYGDIDVAVTQADVFEYFKTQHKTPNLPKRIQYVLRLPIAELHVLARDEIRTIQDLRGKKVNFGPVGSGSSLTGSVVFDRLGVQVKKLAIDQESALEKLSSGEIAALVRIGNAPVDFFTKIPAWSGVHLLSIPFSKTFADYYTLGAFTANEYPQLVRPGEVIDTIAVPTVLAIHNWPKGSDHYNRVARFTERLFAGWDRLQKPPFHPKWRDVNLAATVPGWIRFAVADEELKRLAPAQSGR